MVIKMQDLVPNPVVALQELKDSNLLDTVIELTGQCLNMGFEIAVDDQAIFNVCRLKEKWIDHLERNIDGNRGNETAINQDGTS